MWSTPCAQRQGLQERSETIGEKRGDNSTQSRANGAIAAPACPSRRRQGSAEILRQSAAPSPSAAPAHGALRSGQAVAAKGSSRSALLSPLSHEPVVLMVNKMVVITMGKGTGRGRGTAKCRWEMRVMATRLSPSQRQLSSDGVPAKKKSQGVRANAPADVLEGPGEAGSAGRATGTARQRGAAALRTRRWVSTRLCRSPATESRKAPARARRRGAEREEGNRRPPWSSQTAIESELTTGVFVSWIETVSGTV